MPIEYYVCGHFWVDASERVEMVPQRFLSLARAQEYVDKLTNFRAYNDGTIWIEKRERLKYGLAND